MNIRVNRVNVSFSDKYANEKDDIKNYVENHIPSFYTSVADIINSVRVFKIFGKYKMIVTKRGRL